MPAEWYALRSKPNKEDFLLDQLLIQKIKAYYPRIRVKPVNPRSHHFRAYFPGYLFVNVELEQMAVSNLIWIPGASRMVSFDGEPASIPEALITAVRKKVESINEVGGELLEALQPGDRVVISTGPFIGYEGIFDTRIDGRDRVRILLNLLQNRQMRLEVPVGKVQLQKLH